MLVVWLLLCSVTSYAVVTVDNMMAEQLPGTKLVTISYDISSDITNAVSVSLLAYDGGDEVLLSSLTGDVGSDIATGIDRSIVWDAGADWNGSSSEGLTFWVIAADEDGSTPSPVPGMVVIPSGTQSGIDPDYGAFSLTSTNSLYMDQSEVTLDMWNSVYQWAIANGYDFDNQGIAVTNGHPITAVSWHDSVKWCNARSEMEGLTPSYTVDGIPYRTGTDRPDWDLGAEGYRLPTSEEWEYAARAGASTRFPQGDALTHDDANYFSSSSLGYDQSATRGFHPDTGMDWPLTLPAGSFAPNHYGLYEIIGNVWEWCWDTDVGGTNRIFRGGSWLHGADQARCGNSFADLPVNSSIYIGIRTVRNAGTSVSGSATTLVDARDYTLAVISDIASTVPDEGLYIYAWGSSVECSAEASVNISGTVYILKGWTGSGSIAASGTTSSTGLIPLTETASTIVWHWLPDNDDDDLPNDWELVYSGTTTGMVASGDSDGDGYSNQEEFWLGTDPTNAISNIDLAISATTNGTVLLSCQTAVGCSYRIQYRESLLVGDWRDLQSFTGSGAIVEVEDSTDVSSRAYRLLVESTIAETYIWQPSVDSDGDELPNDWEAAYFGTATSAYPNEDPDHDGYTNLEELWLGSSPIDPDSNLDFSVAGDAGGTVTISCWTASDRLYFIEYSDSLYPIDWKLLAGFVGNGKLQSYEDSAATGCRFYRIRVDLPPEVNP